MAPTSIITRICYVMLLNRCIGTEILNLFLRYTIFHSSEKSTIINFSLAYLCHCFRSQTPVNTIIHGVFEHCSIFSV